MPNTDEIAYWNDEAGSRWAKFAERIDRAFEPLSAAGLASASAASAEAVLDIGCGCGTTLLALAGAVGANGSVVGLDVSVPMLAVARQRALALRHASVRFVLGDAATYPLGEATFDLEFSRFGVMFFEDPVGAFVNLRRALRPNGRLVFICWRELAANPWFAVPAEAVRPFVAPQPKPDPEAPGPLAFADPMRVRRILERADFEAVQLAAFDAKLPLGTRAQAVELLSQIGPAARLLAGAGDAARASAARALDDGLKPHEAHDQVLLAAGVWIVVARPVTRP